MGVVCTLGIAGTASAALIEVSQETSAGAGDFDANVLGQVDAFSTGMTIAGFYQYGNPFGASYNGDLNGGPVPVSSMTQGFFVDASDGIHYVVVHDRPNDGSGGNTRMTTVVEGGAGGSVGFSVEDDPTEGTSASDVGLDRILDTVHNWAPCCTDGYAVGALSVGDTLFAYFDVAPTGISSWQSTGDDLTSIATALDPERRVRYRIVEEVPEPGALAFVALGLIAVPVLRARRGGARG